MLTKNGKSTTTKLFQFQTESFYSCFYKCWMVEWEYMNSKGVVLRGVARSVEAAKKQTARWGYSEAA
jgi:rhamnogalacturonyl hydrolase YesR